MASQEQVGAVIAAAGSSERMGGVDKMFAPLGEKPVLVRVVATFQNCRLIDQIVVAVNKSILDKCRELAAGPGWTKVSFCEGGRRRQDSVANALSQLKSCQWVVIHDGARPLVSETLIKQGLEEAKETGAAVAAVPVTDTIKIAGGDRLVQETLSRGRLWAVQTPQVFRADIINKAYRQMKSEVTDDAALVEQLGHKVRLYPGAYDNIKITTPDDLTLAEILWQRRENAHRYRQ
jgi:2-C-methyl-D-erythritol 4-phosphate cytidylyltransferase